MVASEQYIQFYKIIVLPRKLATGSIHDYQFYYCPLMCILFEIQRIGLVESEINWLANLTLKEC